MKRYLKNKDFVPEKFYNKVELNNSKKENKVIVLFLIINLFLLPITAKHINEVKEKSTSHNNIHNIKQNKIQLDDINMWVENIIRDDIEEAYIDNNNGEIVVNDLNKIDELSTNTSIEINDINLNNNEKYKLGVSLNE